MSRVQQQLQKMRVLWISCLLLGIVTTLPLKRVKRWIMDPWMVRPEEPFPYIYEQPSAPPTRRKTDRQYVGYNNPSVAGYEGALPVAAPTVPHGGLYPTMESGAGYEAAGPVVQYVGYPVASNYYDGPAAAFPVYEVPDAAAPHDPNMPGLGFALPINPYSAGYGAPVATTHPGGYGAPVATRYPGGYGAPVATTHPDGYGAPVATTHPDGYGAPVATRWGFGAPVATTHPDGYGAPVATTHPDGQEVSVGGEANEPVFSDVSDLKPVSSFNSRSRYQRGKTVFYEATYIPEEVPVPAETSYTPEEGPVPETSYTPWLGYPTRPMRPPVMNPVKQHYPPSNAVKRRY